MTRVIALTERNVPSGILYDGDLFVKVDDGDTLVDSVLSTLRAWSIDLKNGDALFFPDAYHGHRIVKIDDRWDREMFGGRGPDDEDLPGEEIDAS